MINQQLLDFIKLQLSHGLTKEKITSDLLANGWTTQDIEEGFKSVVIPGPSVPTPPSSFIPPVYSNINFTITPIQTKNKSNNNPFSHKGRIGRLKYFISTLILSISTALLSVVLLIFSLSAILAGVIGFLGNLKTSPSMGEYFMALLIPILPILILGLIVSIIGYSLAVKRFHDLNKSGWHALALIVPLYNIYLTLGLLFQCGTEGMNQYGDDTLSVEKNHDDFLNKLGSSVAFKIIVTILLFILSVVSSYQNNLAKKQAEQRLQQNIVNSLITTPSSTNNSSGATTVSKTVEPPTIVTSTFSDNTSASKLPQTQTTKIFTFSKPNLPEKGPGQFWAPYITKIEGSVILKINEKGVWHVNAEDPEGGKSIYFQAEFNDPTPSSLNNGWQNQSNSYVGNDAFAHYYSKPGTYSIDFMVRNEKGGFSQKSIRVAVK